MKPVQKDSGNGKKAGELSQGLRRMQEKYGQALKLISNEYRHANELSYFIKHLKNSDDSFADIAEQYEIENLHCFQYGLYDTPINVICLTGKL
ncbi:hypothetical protein OZX72_03520 [Bifidobacterium sp. ESL0769]|uniref:hypothetical protein n=1 Tax=Bifidobacterium sp. ESL0769 TaxID=2983229 RepID=UPI0023F97649|nr:hypothetical protein [Bifidobacterium sp. ESL0769]WEV68060.1 hypothetical protein OZX72_03520 [Bifidobacterium sp. ESL0769]